MAISEIFVRSPFILEIDVVGQTGSKIELYIYKNGTTPPTLPSYTLEKLIPASNNTQTLYNISPYLMEYIKHDSFQNNFISNTAQLNVDEYILVDVKRYYLIAGTYVLIDTLNFYAYDGYGYYQQGVNPSNLFLVHLEPKNYYFWSGANNNPTFNPLQRAGTFVSYLENGYSVKYTQLQTGLSFTNNIIADGVYNLYRVYSPYYLTGNKVEVFNTFLQLVWESTFYPIEECYYDVITVDFINMYGVWQREFFFKASYESLSVSATEFNLMQVIGASAQWDTNLNQRQVFNTNGIITHRVNTGWVDESFNSNLQQLLLSERILLNGNPVKMKSKELSKEKNLNNKKINYTLEFEESYDLINNVI